MKNLFSSRRQSLSIVRSPERRRSSTDARSNGHLSEEDLPQPPRPPDQNQSEHPPRLLLNDMDEFAVSLEQSCRQILSRLDSVSSWSLSVCTVDGKRVNVGESRDVQSNLFPLNELCYLLNYCLATETLGSEKIGKFFASKPIPRERDEFSLHADGRVWNPLCRSGGLMLTSLLFPDDSQGTKLSKIHDFYTKMSGNSALSCDNWSYNMKRLHSHGEIGLIHYLAFNDCFPQGANIQEILDIYFQMCATAMSPEAASIVAAVFANNGKCPFTEDVIIPEDTSKVALKQILNACSADKVAQAECEKYGIWLANRSGAGLLIIPGVLGMSFSIDGVTNQQSARCLRLVVQKVRQLIKLADDPHNHRPTSSGGSSRRSSSKTRKLSRKTSSPT